MSLLLDTHIWLWTFMQSSRLSSSVRSLLEGNADDLWLSPVSVWELLLLINKQRLKLDRDTDQWLQDIRSAAPAKEAALTHAVVWETKEFKLAHRDPADKFLVATARVFDLTLVTADERLINARACKVLANR